MCIKLLVKNIIFYINIDNEHSNDLTNITSIDIIDEYQI